MDGGCSFAGQPLAEVLVLQQTTSELEGSKKSSRPQNETDQNDSLAQREMSDNLWSENTLAMFRVAKISWHSPAVYAQRVFQPERSKMLVSTRRFSSSDLTTSIRMGHPSPICF